MKSKVKLFRTFQGLTQAELGEKVGVRRETILFLEKGKYNPSLRLAWRLSEALDVKIDDLFSFDPIDDAKK